MKIASIKLPKDDLPKKLNALVGQVKELVQDERTKGRSVEDREKRVAWRLNRQVAVKQEIVFADNEYVMQMYNSDGDLVSMIPGKLHPINCKV